MPTVDELLNASNEVTTCTINPDTREIIVPEKYKILGVFSDEKVTKIPFTCPRVVGNNVDLTEYNLYINYQNASGASNAYLIDDIAVSGDNITFSWLLSRYVTFSQGVVKYNFCAKKLDGDTISNEWNTTIATGLVIQGLEATREIIEENPDIIEALISKAHTHENKLVLDKFAEIDGKPTYDGKALGGGGSVDSVNGKTGAVVLTAEDINYDNDNTVYELMSQWSVDLETVGNALTTLDEKSHTHDNKDTLDKLSDSNGKLQYNGSDVGLKGDKGDKGDPGSDANVTKANVITALGYTPEAVSTQVTTGSNITLADNTEYRLTDVTTLTLTYPTGNFECWMRLTFAESGNITVTLPTGTRYIGNAPSFANGETWEMSIKDGVVIAQKVGDGT